MPAEIISEKNKQYLSILLLCACTIQLVGLQNKLAGWSLLALGILTLAQASKNFRRNLLLIYISIAILGITPINTQISWAHMLIMGTTIGLALALPYLISRYIYLEHAVRFRFHHGRQWYKSEIIYILATATAAYFLVPFYLKNTGSYHNWTVDAGAANVTRLFVGTNALGIWDELFFISTIFGILRRYIPFTWANLAQAVLFTSFLYELGFRGWGPVVIFPFALSQGYIFKKTESLFYVITIHLTLDLVLFLALLNAHHPSWVPIFVTG